MQVFYQGIDKVSKVIENPVSPDDDPPDDAEREEKGEAGEDGTGEGGGDGTTEPAEDSPAKEDDELDENGDGEKHELTDEELAARCRCCVFCRGCDESLFDSRRGPRSQLWNVMTFLSTRVLRYITRPKRRCSFNTMFSYTVSCGPVDDNFLYAAHSLPTPQVCRIG